MFDLETTSLSRDSDILQISAVCTDSDKSFNRYIFPSKSISKQSSDLTKLSIVGSNLCHDGKVVQCSTLHEALSSFISFVSESGENSILIGHNIAAFDIPVLSHHMAHQKLNVRVLGCLDSYTASKQLFTTDEIPDYKQATLVRHLLNVEYDAHNAIEDVKALKKVLINHILPKLTPRNITDLLFHVDSHFYQKSYSKVLGEKAASELTVRKIGAQWHSF